VEEIRAATNAQRAEEGMAPDPLWWERLMHGQRALPHPEPLGYSQTPLRCGSVLKFISTSADLPDDDPH
jgi:hypothetical protein